MEAVPAERTALLICINFGNEDETVSYTRHVLQQADSARIQILIVDNTESCEQPKLGLLAEQMPQVTLRKAPRNLGYFGAASWAFQWYTAQNKLPEWTLVTNTDIEFADERFLSDLFKMDLLPSEAVIAPRIIAANPDRDQNPFKGERPSPSNMFWSTVVMKTYLSVTIYDAVVALLSKLSNRHKKARIVGEPLTRRHIYAPHGSFLIFNRRYFEAGGTFAYGAFLFSEEIFVAETARRLGLRIVFEPGLVVLHREHATTGGSGILRGRRRATLKRQSTEYCYETFFRHSAD